MSFLGTIAGINIGLILVSIVDSSKLHPSTMIITVPLAVLFSWLTWRQIKKEQN